MQSSSMASVSLEQICSQTTHAAHKPYRLQKYRRGDLGLVLPRMTSASNLLRLGPSGFWRPWSRWVIHDLTAPVTLSLLVGLLLGNVEAIAAGGVG